MKKKITLGIESSLIESIKSKETFQLPKMEKDGENILKSESQKASERLLEKLAISETISDFEMKAIIQDHVKNKYA
ncbi:hypothetical protein MMU07_19085 [Aquiflexum sp. LQ15W]|uniref:hypothetical protein n=1 Tax=Cognataquiflexum nitidum TaxID=2922272 RepID=UPI001F13628F|nr:hypothetical protein [Cognataquiflexum nitidum]MCH6201693.1 hypothetical protein [Cognataquiflexum nitidum]